MITIKQVAVEEVPAWVECSCGDGRKWKGPHYDESVACPNCKGAGGKWHDAVTTISDGTTIQAMLISDYEPTVTKTSILTRTHEVCMMCEGCGDLCIYMSKGVVQPHDTYSDCPHCQDGCEPNTASEWEVR